MLQIGQQWVRTQVSQDGMDIVRHACNRAVDAFTGQQNHAFDLAAFTKRQQGRLALGVVWQVNKLVKSGGQINRLGHVVIVPSEAISP